MIKKYCLLISSIIVSYTSFAQIGIGTQLPHSSSILDIESDSKGFLPPRMTTAERDVINGGSISEGLIIYNNEDNCLNVFNGASWINLCSNSGSSVPTINTDIEGTLGGDYPGYANTNVFRNIKLRKSDMITYLSSRTADLFLGEDRKTIYTNNGVLYSSRANYQQVISYPYLGNIGNNRALLSTVEVLAVNDRLSNKTWKEFDYVSNSTNISDVFLLSTDGDLYSLCLFQRAVNYPKRGVSTGNINPLNDDQAVLIDAAAYNGVNKYEVYQHLVDDTDASIKFDFISLIQNDNVDDLALLTYAKTENKFYSLGVKYGSAIANHTKPTAGDLFRTTTPATLKDAYILKEADMVNNMLEIFTTEFKVPEDDEVTIWVDQATNRLHIITTDGYANVITGNTIKRIEFPTGVEAKSYVGKQERAAILGSDGKLYDSGFDPVAYAPIVYVSRSQTHNAINYSIQENTNLPNKLFAPNATDLNNYNIKSAHGYPKVTYLTTDGTLYHHTNVTYSMTNATSNSRITNLSTLYTLDPVANIAGNTSDGGAIVSSNTGITYSVHTSNTVDFRSRAMGIPYNSILAFNEKGKAELRSSLGPTLWYSFMPL